MGNSGHKHLGKSKKYKNVYKYRNYTNANEIFWYGEIHINLVGQKKYGFTDERECAKWVDLQLIRAGKPPKNVLKKK